MKNTMEINNLDRELYTREQKIDTAIGVCSILIFFIALVA
tara:strand:+ start:62406 stop:62525 length:120 start_codon:yes stop_codon:yes gene_type:complete